MQGYEALFRLANEPRRLDDWTALEDAPKRATAEEIVAGLSAGVEVDDDIISFETETLWSRELGFKWQSADRRLRASGAVFYITSDNRQDVQIATDENVRPVSSDFIGPDGQRVIGIDGTV